MTGQALLNDLLKIADKNSSDTGYRALGLVWLDYVIKDIQNRQQSAHWKFLEVIGNTFSLIADDFDYAFSSIASNIDTTKVMNVYDKINDRTYRFIPYDVFKQFVADEKNASGNPWNFSIAGEQLLLWPVPNFTAITGTTDGDTADKLVDSTATFITDAIKVGMRVTNTTDSTTALVTAVDSETILTLDTDIMDNVEGYSIAEAVHIDFVKILIDAADNATALAIPDKYKKVVMDGLLEWAFKFDPELGKPVNQNAIYEAGVDRMIRDNGQYITENFMPISHRTKHHRGRHQDNGHGPFFPLGSENF